MSFQKDVDAYMIGFAPAVGPCRRIKTNQWVPNIEKSSAIVEGWVGDTNDNIAYKQWKVFYSGGYLTHKSLLETEWAPRGS